MSEEQEVTPPVEADAEETEAASLAVDVSGNKMVPLSALIAAKKEGKGYRDKVKELEPIAASATELGERLEKAQPFINAMLTNPKLRAEAIRAASGTRTTNETTEQPDDDPDAAAMAEDMGFYLSDGTTPDVARAQRVIGRVLDRAGRQTDQKLQPLAGMTLGRAAEENVRMIRNMVDPDTGARKVSDESLKEAIQAMGGPQSSMLANPQVGDLLLTVATGLDARFGRTPKAPDEPVYMERAGAGRGGRQDALDPELRAAFQRLGVDEKQGQAAVSRLEQGVAGRRGITLGGK